MSAGRIVDLIVLALIIVSVFALTFTSAASLDPLRNDLNEKNDDTSKIKGDKYRNEMYTVVTKWLPLITVAGSVLIVLFREYRRQRVAARRGRV